MRVLLHIGMPRAGAAELQETLAGHREELRAAGVLYPTTVTGNSSHNELTFLLASLERIPQQYRSEGVGIEDLHRHGSRVWVDIRRQVEEEAPHTVVLSAEYLAALRGDDASALASYVRELSDDIRVVVYVFAPPAAYLALVQRMVRTTGELTTPADFRYGLRRVLGTYARAFAADPSDGTGSGPVSVHAYDPALLVGGSVVDDFLHNHVPGGGALLQTMTAGDEEEPVSAEALCILQQLRRANWPGDDGVYKAESSQVLRTLRAMGDEVPQTPPALRADIHAALDAAHAADVTWLEERFHAEMPPASSPVGEGEPPGWRSADLRDVLEVDRDAVDDTTYRLLKTLAARVLAGPRQAGDGRFHAAPGLFDHPPGRGRIFVIGLNRTGTRSLHEALEGLGYSSLHWGGPESRLAIERALRERRPLLDYLDDYDAFSDLQRLSSNFHVLDRQYPGSKFILTTRDLDSWLDSRRRHVEQNVADKAAGTYHGTFLTVDVDAWRELWQVHHARVRDYFEDRPDDLLVMDIIGGDGYELLCPFLGVEAPDEPFPWRTHAGRSDADDGSEGLAAIRT